jgi:chromate transporter
MKELALAFLRLGTTAFGGPAVHIAMMEEEFVRRRAWLTREQFLDLVSAAGLIPGPSSTEVAIYIGQRRAGWRGLLVAGLCFVLPAALMVTAIAWTYVRWGRLPAVGGALQGVKPVIIAVLGQALVSLGAPALRSTWRLFVGVCAASASVLGAPPLVVLSAAAAASAANHLARRPQGGAATLVWPGGIGAAAAAAPATLGKLFFVFLKLGSVVFGSGYVLLAFLHTDLVERTHWLTERQLIDAVAVGQFTPGPVFTTATFIGYVVAGAPGACVATLGIFLPSFVLVALSGHIIPRLRRSPVAGAVLDGVNAASIALMAVVGARLARSALFDVRTFAIAIASAAALLRWRVNSAWLVLGGGVVGALLWRHA